MRPIMRAMAGWDRATAARVDRFLANSQYVAGRIGRYYNRRSAVVHPPVDTDFYTPESRSSSRGFLIVSALVPYKRLDVAIEACRRLAVPLTIVGTGPEEARLRALAGPDVRFLGWLPDEAIRALYRSATATLLPGIEDFGIVPVESQACGTPVVALNDGGAPETVVDGQTGVLVPEPTAEAFTAGLSRAMQAPFDPAVSRANALRFSKRQFVTSIKAALNEAIAEKSGGRLPALVDVDDSGMFTPPVEADRENALDAAKMPASPLKADRENALDAARMPPSPVKADRENALDAARMPPPPVKADRENKQ
jgi:glycosyltransferase involved in cell wall biosynthesis